MENETPNALAEDWELLMSFFPADWQRQAQTCGALKGLRQDKSAEVCLRVLLLHLGCGFSLRETIVRAQQAGLADLSDVALLKRLRKSKAWLRQLCCGLFAERRCSPLAAGTPQWRLLDGSLVSEPGKTGSQWRIHYSLRWPSLECDYFKLLSCGSAGGGGPARGFLHRATQSARHSIANPGRGSGAAGRVPAGVEGGWPDRRVAGADPLDRSSAALGGATVRGAQEYGGDRLGAAEAPPQSVQTGVASATRELALRAVCDGLEHLPSGRI
jgi:hypothetical protein